MINNLINYSKLMKIIEIFCKTINYYKKKYLIFNLKKKLQTFYINN